MAVGVDFENDIFNLMPIINTEDRAAIFESQLQDGVMRKFKVEIDNECHPLLPNVYNLAFGPMDKRGNIDDRIRLKHRSYGRVFATIVLHAGIYLSRHPMHCIGIDGSTNERAWLYYRFIRRNFEYLRRHFQIYGLKYYVRITRLGKTQYDNPFDFADILPDLVPFEESEVVDDELMYNYFIFSKKA